MVRVPHASLFTHAPGLGKEPAALRIYDPFFCAGAAKTHLAALGFSSVYNKCEDFYKVQAEGKVPFFSPITFLNLHLDIIIIKCLII